MKTRFDGMKIIAEGSAPAECESCGGPATKRVTYILSGGRSDPRSSAYGKDDCSWCADDEGTFCDDCAEQARRNPPPGYKWCAMCDGARFPHMITKSVKYDASQFLALLKRLARVDLSTADGKIKCKAIQADTRALLGVEEEKP